MDEGANKMESNMKEFIESFSEKLKKEYSKQQDFAFELEDLLANPSLQKNLRISQIDLIDILSTPEPDSNEITNLIRENGLVEKESLPPDNAQYRRDLTEHLNPYGINYRDWDNFHGQGFDAFDLPKIPKRSISISFDQGKSGAWAPNGYGKTFAFEKVLRLLEITSESDPNHAFEDFLRQCTALLQPRPDSESTFDEAQLQKNSKRLIPFRMLCFSVQAFEGDFATDVFSVSIDIEYNSGGHYLAYNLTLHPPETRNNFVVEQSVILPNWILENETVVDLNTKKYSSTEKEWKDIGLRLLLNMKIDYLELPKVAFSPKAEKIVQENIAVAVKACIESAVSQDYPDLDISKIGLLTALNKLDKNRFLVQGLETLTKEIFASEDSSTGPGQQALENLVSELKDIQDELKSLVGADGESWRLHCELLTPSYERANSLDITNAIHPTAILIWKHLSFGQRNELLFKSTLLRSKYSHPSDKDKQRVLVIDEPEAGRSEEWVSHLIDDIGRFDPNSSVLILSHRGIVLESANPEGKYKILHTALPEEDDFEEDELFDWLTYKKSVGDAATIDKKLTLVRAFSPSPVAETWSASFPEAVTPSAERGWIKFGGPNHLWFLKPTQLDKETATQISTIISNVSCTNESLLKLLWNGFQWIPSQTQSRYETLKDLDSIDFITASQQDQLYLLHVDYPGTLTTGGVGKTAIAKFSTLPGITSGGIRLPKKPEQLFELINFANKHEKLTLNPGLLRKEKQRLKDEFKISHTLSNKFLKFLKLTNVGREIPDNLDIDDFLKILNRNLESPTDLLKQNLNQSKGNLKDLELYYQEIRQFYSHNHRIDQTSERKLSRVRGFFEYLRDDLQVELQFEINELLQLLPWAPEDPVVPEQLMTFDENDDADEPLKGYKWREDVLLRVMASHEINESQRDLFLRYAVNFDKGVKGYLKKAFLDDAASEYISKELLNDKKFQIDHLTLDKASRNYYTHQNPAKKMEIITIFGTKYPEYRMLQQAPYPDIKFWTNSSKTNYAASQDNDIMPAIMALDTLKSHNHSGDFHFHGYSWCVRSLGVIRNNEFKIPDYACELILAYAECLHRKNPPDDLTIESAIEYNPEVAEGAEILIDDYIRSAAEEISKLNKDIDYDRFEDPCGPAALIRVDMVTDDEEYSQIGYRCMNCNMVYDDGYRKI
jgi:hypothetical protein